MWLFCLIFIEVWHLWLSWRDALHWSWWNYQGCWQAAGLWYFLFLYHSFTVSQRRWGGGWAGDSYVVCLHLTTPNQDGGRKQCGMFDSQFFFFFHFSYWLEHPREPPWPNYSRKTSFLIFNCIFFGDDMKVIASYITVVLPHPWHPSFPLSHQIEWGANFSL